MRPLLIFLLCAAPATALLAYLDRLDKGGDDLPDDGPPADEPALLLGSDLADPYGQSPFPGAVRRLDGFELRVVAEGYFKLYLRIERLGRHDDRPRLEDVSVVVFDPPKEGKPSLRLTLRAPYVRGDPRELLHAPASAPRVVTLEGGVEAFDTAGRPLAEVERLSLDVNGKTAFSDVPVVLRLPERSAEVRGAGLDADLGLRKARLRGPVLASIALPSGTITLRAKEYATVEEAEGGNEIRVAFEGDAEIEQAAGRATCARIDATFVRADGRTSFLDAKLSGGVRLELAPGTAGGLETIEMPSLVIDGEETISCEGPLRAAWRGQLGSLALGERTVRIDAAKARLRLGRSDEGLLLLGQAHFDDFSAADVDGAGSLVGRSFVYTREGNVLVVQPAVAETPDGRLVAAQLRIEAPEKDAYDVVISGKKQLSYRAGGRLGLLGDPGRGHLHVMSEGPLRLRARGDRVLFEGEIGVVVTSDGGGGLLCDTLALALEKKELVSFLATGNVAASDPSRGAEVRGDEISHKARKVVVKGSPASVTMKADRSLRAPTITYGEDGTFVATGGVEAETPLSDHGPYWRLKCGEASGVLAKGGAPSTVEAHGGVRAEGPGGEEIVGDALSYDGGKGVVALDGAPARLRRGDEISLVAPKGLLLLIEEGRVVEGSSLGPATIDYRPPATPDGKTGGFRRWLAELKGPARFEGDRVIVEEGAKLTGSDGERDALVGEAKRVEILLDVSGKKVAVQEILGSKGVRVEGRGKTPAVVTADRLSYVAHAREVRVAGDAQVVAEGWPRDVRFRELLFALTKDGIDLLRASDIEVR